MFFNAENVTFRSKEQEEAIDFVLNSRENHLLTVMPTGMGKSLLFMIPAKLQPQLTQVVVVPYVALMEELCW